ncbi:MAG: helix-turn-helix transcriptional regulator, partial [Mesorhizobium sp.]|nr:helix-turn-helix transcriptional regulator [Mesorhizobium sp.]
MKAKGVLAKAKRATKSSARPKAARRTLSREAWIAAARKVLEKRGIGEVKIDHLALQLKVTRGSFYCHFTSLADLRN